MNLLQCRSGCRVALLAIFLTGATLSAQIQRVPNTSLALPSAPPTYGYTSVNAFGSLTFTNPVAMATPPGETNRVFVLGKNGTIYVITNLAIPTRSVFMDVQNRVTSTGNFSGTSGEEGLLGLAFHPGYATNGYFYVYYTGQATNYSGSSALHDILSRFQVSASNTNQGDPNSEVRLISQYDRDPNHNAGDVHFGPDGYLYLSLGDEGAEHDGRTNSQHIDWNLFAGILRIDPDKRPGNLAPNPGTEFAISTNYLIPADNPFVGATSFDGATVNPSAVHTEFWAVGLRNPFRYNFDPLTGVLYCGDVGQDQYEEVDVITRGGNYGWATWEATNTPPSGVGQAGRPVAVNPIAPIVSYVHGSASNQGNCVIGGVVYRGQKLPQLYGYYIFGDDVDGHVWAIPASQTNITVNPPTPLFTNSVNISAFGVDPASGDVLYTALNSGNNGTVNRIIYNTTTNGAPLPPTLADTGAFTNLLSLTSPQDPLQPAPGILPYDINVPFWSDNAIKTRWFAVPNTNLTIGFNPNGNWTFPTGTVWIKHFNLQLTNGDPTSVIRLETRLLVKNAAGIYGMTYRWGGSQTNATLVPAGGMNESFVINNGGILTTQTWHYPSQQECQTCHTPAGGYGLGFRTEQLNHNYDYGTGTGPTNEILALSHAGYFSSPVTNDPTTLTALAAATNATASLEFRARSFLSANCSQCHQPGGVQAANWDARITTPTALAGLINGALFNNFGNASNAVIAPRSPTNSVLLTRISTRDLGNNNSRQMPPLDSYLVDTQAVQMVNDWVLSLSNTFWIGATPDPLNVSAGNAASATVTNLETGDFTGSVALSVGGLPAGATGGFNPPTLSGSGASTLTLTTAGITPPGSYIVTISGSGSGQTNLDTITLIVTTNSNFTAAPGTLAWNATNGVSPDINWSSSYNWTNLTAGGTGTPGISNDVKFTSSGTTTQPGTVNNIVDQNLTVNSLAYTNLTGFHRTFIQPGVTLTVSVNPAVSGSGNNQAGLTVGAQNFGSALAAMTNSITGPGGTLVITNGDLVVAQGAGQNDAHTVVLDMSGLDTFIMNTPNAGWVAVGGGGYNGSSASRACGTLYLAKTNFINTRFNFRLGNVSTANANMISAIYLGQSNAITVGSGDDVSVGYTGGTNLMKFQPGLTNPTATFRSVLSPPRVPTWNVGVNSTGLAGVGTNDFTGGVVDLMAADMRLGRSVTTTTALGVLTFDAGVMDVNTLEAGQQTVSAGGTAAGIINVNSNAVNGAAALVVNTTLTLTQVTGTLTPGTLGALNINGGKVNANIIYNGGGTALLTINNGSLTLTNTAGSPAAPLTAVSLTYATLHLSFNGAANFTNIEAGTLTAAGVNTIQIDAVANTTGITTNHLIGYTTLSGSVAANFNMAPLPAGYSGYLVGNVAGRTIDLVVAPSANVTPRFGAVAWSGTNLILNGSNGFPFANYYLLASTNVTWPASTWWRISTNPFNSSGGFNLTNPANSSQPQMFYQLQLP